MLYKILVKKKLRMSWISPASEISHVYGKHISNQLLTIQLYFQDRWWYYKIRLQWLILWSSNLQQLSSFENYLLLLACIRDWKWWFVKFSSYSSFKAHRRVIRKTKAWGLRAGIKHTQECLPWFFHRYPVLVCYTMHNMHHFVFLFETENSSAVLILHQSIYDPLWNRTSS